MTPEQIKKLERLANVIDKGNIAILEYLNELENKIDTEIPAIKTIISRVKGEDGKTPTKEELIALIEPLIPEVKDGENGKDYILTEQDKKDIASEIKVPVVEKIIEKTEVIKEQPIITNEIKEVAVKDSPIETRDKLESLPDGEKLKQSAIQDLPEKITELEQLTKESKKIVGGGSIARNFYQLFDVPQSYAGQSLKALRVKSDETGLEFFTGSGLIDWGEIGGTLSNQTDLQNALNAKLNTSDYKWTTVGNDIYNNNSCAVLIGGSTNDGSEAKLQVTGNENLNNGSILLDSSYGLNWSAVGTIAYITATQTGQNSSIEMGNVNKIYLQSPVAINQPSTDNAALDITQGSRTYAINATGNSLFSGSGFFGGNVTSAIVNAYENATNNVALAYDDGGGNIYAIKATGYSLFCSASQVVAKYVSTDVTFSGVVFDTDNSTADPFFQLNRQGAVKGFFAISHTNDAFYYSLGNYATGKKFEIATNGTTTIQGYDPVGGVSDLNGTLLLGSTAAYQGSVHYDANGNTVLYFDNSYDNAAATTKIRMRTAGTAVDAITILGSGNVGLGVSPGTYKLNVNGTSYFSDKLYAYHPNNYADSLVAIFSTLAVNGSSELQISSYGTQTNTIIGATYAGYGYIGTTTDYPFYILQNNAAKLVIKSGKVGILTTAPDKALEINLGTSDALRLTYNDSNGSAANYTDFTLGSNGALTLTSTANAFTFGNGVADTDLTFNFSGTSNSGVLKWMEDEDWFQFDDAVKLGGAVIYNYTAQTGTYAIAVNDYMIDCTSGTFTATLPTAVNMTGKKYVIKNTGTGVVTVATTSSQTIDGQTTMILGVQNESLTVMSNGSNWIVI